MNDMAENVTDMRTDREMLRDIQRELRRSAQLLDRFMPLVEIYEQRIRDELTVPPAQPHPAELVGVFRALVRALREAGPSTLRSEECLKRYGDAEQLLARLENVSQCVPQSRDELGDATRSESRVDK